MNPRQASRACTIDAVASLPNLYHAAARARLGKSRRPDVEDWWLHREAHLERLHQELLGGAWQPSGYRFFEIREPKRRLIAAAPFGDRVVHHALCNLLAPVLERRFIARSFSCQIGKGTTAARECCRILVNRHCWVMKCDIAKFFPSIDHALLAEALSQLVRCPKVNNLIAQILASYVSEPWAANVSGRTGDSRPCGLPIGNLTSQLWGNFFLDGLDHWITETERHGAYVRYTDDFLLFGDDKSRLWELREGIVAHLTTIRLRLAEPKSRLLSTREGVPFCGFRFLPERRPRILGATKRRFEARRYRLFSTLTRPQCAGAGQKLSQAIFAWYQFSREANADGLRRAYAQWPLDSRLKRRRRKSNRVLRGGSWNNDNPENFTASNRNNNHPDNRNDNNGFRCVSGMGLSPKSGNPEPGFGVMSGGAPLPGRCQEASLTVAPAPTASVGKDTARAVAGNPARRDESHGSQPVQLELDLR